MTLRGLCFLDGLGLDISQKLGELSVEQRTSFDRFCNETFPAARKGIREAEEVQLDDFTLLRFLRADKYNDKKAAERLIKTLRWWSSQGVEVLLDQPPPMLSRYQKLRVRRMNGYDRLGRVVMLERLGEFLGCYNTQALELDDWIRCYTHEILTIYQLLRESSRQRKAPIETIAYVGDLSGLRFMSAMHCMRLMKSFTEVVEVHFPEIAGPLFLINAPSVAMQLFNVAKRFLDPVVASKIQIHNNVPTAQILEVVPSELLPVEFGGTSKFVLPHVIDAKDLDINQDGFGVAGPDSLEAAAPEPNEELHAQRQDTLFLGCWSGVSKLCSPCGSSSGRPKSAVESTTDRFSATANADKALQPSHSSKNRHDRWSHLIPLIVVVLANICFWLLVMFPYDSSWEHG